MSKFSLHKRHETARHETMTCDYDRFLGDAEISALGRNSRSYGHSQKSPEVPRLVSLSQRKTTPIYK